MSDDLQLKSDKPRVSEVLYLTNISRSQQTSTDLEELLKRKWAIKARRNEMKGQKFKTRPYPPASCYDTRIVQIRKIGDKTYSCKYMRIGCNTWGCPRCQLKKALFIKHLLTEIAKLNNLDVFLTLTLDPDKIPIEYKSDSINRMTGTP